VDHDLASDVIDLASDARAWLAGDRVMVPVGGQREAPSPDASFAEAFQERTVDVLRRLDAVGIPGTTTTGVPPAEARAHAYVQGGHQETFVEDLFAMARLLAGR
jgi:hypothetical protein